MEWLWRALSEPRRLGKRYLKILMLTPLLLLEHVMALAAATELGAEGSEAGYALSSGSLPASGEEQ